MSQDVKNDADLKIKIAALHKHWITADAIKHFVGVKVSVKAEDASIPYEDAAQAYSMILRMSVFYALEYVVIEGYKELKLTDKKIDVLLQQENMVDFLRLFRNAVFHYQSAPFSEKLIKFLDAPESEVWIKKIHSAFDVFFTEALGLRQIVEALKTAK